RHVLAEPGQRAERLRRARPPAGARELTRRGVKVPRPGVVPETRPGREHVLLRGAREPLEVREPLEELLVTSEDGRDGRLLEHDLGDPDPIGVARSPPGETAPLPAKPRDQPVADAVATPGRGRQETVTSVRGAIQPDSFMRSRTKAFSASFG